MHKTIQLKYGKILINRIIKKMKAHKIAYTIALLSLGLTLFSVFYLNCYEAIGCSVMVTCFIFIRARKIQIREKFKQHREHAENGKR